MKNRKLRAMSYLALIIFITVLPLLLTKIIPEYAGLYVITVNYSGETVGVAYCTAPRSAIRDAFKALTGIIGSKNMDKDSKELTAAMTVRAILEKVTEAIKMPFIYGCSVLARVTLPVLEKLYAINTTIAKKYGLLVKLGDGSYLVVSVYDETIFLLAPLSATAMAVTLFKALIAWNGIREAGRGHHVESIQLLSSIASYILVLLLVFTILLAYAPHYYLQLYILNIIVYSISAATLLLILFKGSYKHTALNTRHGYTYTPKIIFILIAAIISFTATQIGALTMFSTIGAEELSPETLTLVLTIALLIPLQVMEKTRENPKPTIYFLTAFSTITSLASLVILLTPYSIREIAPLIILVLFMLALILPGKTLEEVQESHNNSSSHKARQRRGKHPAQIQ